MKCLAKIFILQCLLVLLGCSPSGSNVAFRNKSVFLGEISGNLTPSASVGLNLAADCTLNQVDLYAINENNEENLVATVQADLTTGEFKFPSSLVRTTKNSNFKNLLLSSNLCNFAKRERIVTARSRQHLDLLSTAVAGIVRAVNKLGSVDSAALDKIMLLIPDNLSSAEVKTTLFEPGPIKTMLDTLLDLDTITPKAGAGGFGTSSLEILPKIDSLGLPATIEAGQIYVFSPDVFLWDTQVSLSFVWEIDGVVKSHDRSYSLDTMDLLGSYAISLCVSRTANVGGELTCSNAQVKKEEAITVLPPGPLSNPFNSGSGKILVSGGSVVDSVVVDLIVTQNTTAATAMQISESDKFESAIWQTIPLVSESTVSFTFAGDGLRNVYMRFKDSQDRVSPIWSDSIIIDTAIPVLSVEVTTPNCTIWTENIALSLSLSEIDAMSVTEMKIASAVSFGSASWQPYNNVVSMTQHSAKNLKAQVKDKFGRESEIVVKHVACKVTLALARDSLTSVTASIVSSGITTLNKALFAGGYSNSSASTVIDIYDALTNTWTLDSSGLSVARYELAAASLGNKAFFAGGKTSNLVQSISDVIDIYNVETGQRTTSALSEARSSLAATTVGTQVLFAGGEGVSLVSDSVDIYDSDPGSDVVGWTVATLSMPRKKLVAVTAGAKAIFAGGEYLAGNVSHASNAVDIYDPSQPNGSRWSSAVLPHARFNLSATVLGNKVFFAGGDDNASIFKVVDVYDVSTGFWSTVSDLSVARYGLAAASVGTKAIFAGGRASSVPPIVGVIDIFDVVSGLWQTSSLAVARRSLTATTVGNKVIFAGGFLSNSKSSDAVDIYDLDTNSWSIYD